MPGAKGDLLDRGVFSAQSVNVFTKAVTRYGSVRDSFRYLSMVASSWRRSVVMLLAAVGMLSGCVVVKNKYSLFEFNRTQDGATANSSVLPLVVGALLLLLAIGMLILGIWLIRRRSRSHAPHEDEPQPPLSS